MGYDTSKPPRGLICPLVTPLKSGDVLDKAALERLTMHVGPSVDALLLGDIVWGEGSALSPDTRTDAAVTALEVVQGKWPVLVTITSRNSKDAVRLVARIEDFIERSGYPGSVFWVDYPIYHHSNRGLPGFYEALASDTDIPLILGNDSGLIETQKGRARHKNIRTSVLKGLAAIDRIKGIIFAGSLRRSLNYHKAVRHCRGFMFYDGNEEAFMKQPSSDGVVAGGANLFPQAWHQVTWSSLNQYDVQREYADHASQVWETGVMLREFIGLYKKGAVAVLKRMLHVAGVLPNAHIAAGTIRTDSSQNRAVEEICRKYDLV